VRDRLKTHTLCPVGMVNRALLARASEKGIPIPWLFPIPGDPLEMIFVMPTFTRWNIHPLSFRNQ